MNDPDIPSDTSAATKTNYHLFDYINSLNSDIYFRLLESIKKEISTDYFTLRMAYTKTQVWNPYDAELSAKYNTIRSLIDSSELTAALKITENILEQRFVDIDAHLYNGYIYKKLGDVAKSDYHYKINKGLIESICASGDGKSAQTAFIVISTTEEYCLLSWFKLHSDQQALLTADGHNFDLLKAIDQKTKKEYDIYFNIDLPFSQLSKNFK
jgi:hypothetical protein